jgi:hypothetical protein
MCICIRIYGTDVEEEEENGKDRLYSLLSIITIRKKRENTLDHRHVWYANRQERRSFALLIIPKRANR